MTNEELIKCLRDLTGALNERNEKLGNAGMQLYDGFKEDPDNRELVNVIAGLELYAKASVRYMEAVVLIRLRLGDPLAAIESVKMVRAWNQVLEELGKEDIGEQKQE